MGEADIVVNNAGYFGSRDMAKDHGREFGLPVSEREIFFVKLEKKEVGPLRWNVVKYGWPRDTHHVIFFAIARYVAVWE